MVQLWIPKDELKADLEDQAKKRLEEIQREAEKRRQQILDAGQAKLNDQRTQDAMRRFNEMVDPLIGKGREALEGAASGIQDNSERARQLFEEAQRSLQQESQQAPQLDGLAQPQPEQPEQPATPPQPPTPPQLPGQEGINNLVGGIRNAMGGLGQTPPSTIPEESPQPYTPPAPVPEVPQTPPPTPSPIPGVDGLGSMAQSMFSAPGLGGLSGLGPLAAARPAPQPLPPPEMPTPPPGLPQTPQPPDAPPGFTPPGAGLGSALADRMRGGMDAVGDKVTEGRDQAMALAQKSLEVAQQAMAGPIANAQQRPEVRAMGAAAQALGDRYNQGLDLRGQANTQAPGFTWDASLAGREDIGRDINARAARVKELQRAPGQAEGEGFMSWANRPDTKASDIYAELPKRAQAAGLGTVNALERNFLAMSEAIRRAEDPTGPEIDRLGTGLQAAMQTLAVPQSVFEEAGTGFSGDEGVGAFSGFVGSGLGSTGWADDVARVTPTIQFVLKNGLPAAVKEFGRIKTAADLASPAAAAAGAALMGITNRDAPAEDIPGMRTGVRAPGEFEDAGARGISGASSGFSTGIAAPGILGGVANLGIGASKALTPAARRLRELPDFVGRLGENLNPELSPVLNVANRMPGGRSGAASAAEAPALGPGGAGSVYEPSLGGQQSPDFTATMTHKIRGERPDLDARIQEFFSKPRTDTEYRGIMNELMGNGTTAEKDLLKEYNKAGPPKASDQAPMPQAFDPEWNPRLKVEAQPNGDVVKTLPSGTRRVEDKDGKILLAEKRTAPDHETFLRGMLDDYAEIRDPKTGERPADFYPVFGGYMSREVSEGKSAEAAAGARHQMFGGWGATTAMTAPPHNLRKTLHINALVNEFIHKRTELNLPARLPTGDEVQVMLRTGKMYFIPRDPSNPARTLDNELPLVEEVPKGGKAQRTIQADLAPVWASGDLEGEIPNLPAGYRLEEVRANKRAGGRVTEDMETKGYAVYEPDTVDANGQTVRHLATHVLAPGVDGSDPKAAQDKNNWVKIKHGSFVNKLPGGGKDKAVPKVAGWNVGSDWRVDEQGLGAAPDGTFVVAEDPAWIVNAPATPKFMKGRGKAAVPHWEQGGKSAGGMWPTSQTKSIVKAIADNVFEVMGGPKGTTFSHTSERAPENLYNPLTVNDIQMADGFGFLRDKMANSAVAHRFMTEKMRALGEEMGLSPQEVQATWWAAIRAEIGNAKAGQPVIREPSTIAGQEFNVGDPVASGSWFEAAGQNQKTLELYRRATQEPIKGAYKYFNPAKGTWENRNVDTTELSYLHKGTALPAPYNPTGPGSRGDLSGRLEVSRTAFTEAEKTAQAQANRFYVGTGDSGRGGSDLLADWGWSPEAPQIAPLKGAMIQHDVSLAPDGNGFLVTLRDTGEGTVHRSASIIGRELNLPEVKYYHLNPEGDGLAYTFARQGAHKLYAPEEVAALSKASGLPLRANPDYSAVYVVDDGSMPDLDARLAKLQQLEQPYGTTTRAERITTGRVPASEYADAESVKPFRALDRAGVAGAPARVPAGEPGGVGAGPGGDLGRALPAPVGGVPLRTASPTLGITPGDGRSPLRDNLDDKLQMAQIAAGAVAGGYQGDEYDDDDKDWERAARIAGGAIGGAAAGAAAPNARRIFRAAQAARAFPPARVQALDAEPRLGIRRKSFEPGDVPEGFDPQSVLRANRTARGENFSKNAVTPRYLVETASPEEAGKVLDFGSGNDAVWTKKLREQGYDVTAHEFGVNTIEGVHDRDALTRQYDTVFASSVLNTQDAPSMMDGTLGQIAKAANPDGRAIFNYPLQPRYWMDPDGPKDPTDGQGRASPETVLAHIQQFFGDVRQVNDDPTRPTWEARDPIPDGSGTPEQPNLLQRAGAAIRRFGAALGDETGELRIAKGPFESKGPPTTGVPARGEQGEQGRLGRLETRADLDWAKANVPEGGYTAWERQEMIRAGSRVGAAEMAEFVKAPENAAPDEGTRVEMERSRRMERRAENRAGAQAKLDTAQGHTQTIDAVADAEDAARAGDITKADADKIRAQAARKLQASKGEDGPPAPGEMDAEVAASYARRGKKPVERKPNEFGKASSGKTALPAGVREVTGKTPVKFPEREVTTKPGAAGEAARAATRVANAPQGADARLPLPGFEDTVPQIHEIAKVANPDNPVPWIEGTAEQIPSTTVEAATRGPEAGRVIQPEPTSKGVATGDESVRRLETPGVRDQAPGAKPVEGPYVRNEALDRASGRRGGITPPEQEAAADAAPGTLEGPETPPWMRGTAETLPTISQARTQPAEPGQIRTPLTPGERRQVLPGTQGVGRAPVDTDATRVGGDSWADIRARDRAAEAEAGRVAANEARPLVPGQQREPSPDQLPLNRPLTELMGTSAQRMVDEKGRLLSKEQILTSVLGDLGRKGGVRSLLDELDTWAEPLKRLVASSKGGEFSPHQVEEALSRMGRGGNAKGGRGASEAWENLPHAQKQNFTKLRPAHVLDAFGTYMRLNLVTNPESFARNVFSTTVGVPYRLFETTTGPIFEGMWASLPRLKETQMSRDASGNLVEKRVKAMPTDPAEGLAMAEGMWKSVAAGLANGMAVLRRGDPERAQTLQRNQLDNPTGSFFETKLADQMGKVFRPLTAGDAMLKTINEGMEAYRLSYRQASGEFDAGKLGADHGRIRTRMMEIMNNPTPRMLDEIQQAGEYNTFNEKAGHLAKVMESIKNWDAGGNEWAAGAWRLGMNFLIPFVRITTNVMKYGWERTIPGGLLSLAQGVATKKSPHEMGQRTARMMEGALMMGALYAADQQGLIEVNGPAPEDDDERHEWELQGRQPYSIGVAGRHFNVGNIPGLAENAGMVGLIKSARRKGEDDEIYGRDSDWTRYGIDALAQYASQYGVRPMFGSVANALGWATASNSGQRKYYEDQLNRSAAGQVSPGSGTARAIGNITDRTQRAPEGFAENVAAIYPWWRENVPARTDSLGDEMETEGSRNWWAGITGSREARDEEMPREFLGSESARMDTEINSAIRAVQNYESDRLRYPAPTAEQRNLYWRFKSRKNPARARLNAQTARDKFALASDRQEGNPNLFDFRAPGAFA